MSKGGAQFTSQELACVLSHYDIGIIQQVKPLDVGSAQTPKKIIVSDRNKFVLKRRPKGKDDKYLVTFAHAIQTHLQEKDFPVPNLVTIHDQKGTALYMGNHAYELFYFVQGSRYDNSNQQARDAGRQLGRFHQYLRNFASKWKPLRGTFHDSAPVRGHLKSISSERGPGGSDIILREVIESLMTHYNKASVHVNSMGFDSWPEQIVHGDWHPGNMLFSSQAVTAVLDFDSVKVAPAVTDLANGLLQFSIVSGRPNPADWPAYLDQAKLAEFLAGYREVVNLQEDMLDVLLDLMVETMIAEAILPVATTGFFGNLSGLDFLKMIRRKCDWIDENCNLLKEVILH